LHDLDFAVPEGAMALARLVSDRLGGAFFPLDEERDTGRVILRAGQGGPVSIDFARFRGEGINEDLSLRDFTINAMALDIGGKEAGRVIDPLDGQADLAAGIIRVTSARAIGDDPVRTLRAVRLAGELGFALDPATARLIREAAPLLKNVSAERLRDELCKILAQPEAAGQLRALDRLELLAPTLPEVAELKEMLERALERVAALEALLAAILPGPGYSGPPGGAGRALAPFAEFLGAHLSAPTAGDHSRLALLKLATLLGDVGAGGQISAVVAEKVARRLRFSKKETHLVRATVAHHRRPYHLLGAATVTRRAAYRFFGDAEGAGLEVLLLSLADHLARQGYGKWNGDAGQPPVETGQEDELWSRHVEVAALLLKTYRDQSQTVISPSPLINGREVMQAFGLSAGPRLGQILARLREEQAAGEVVDRAGAMAYVARLLGEGPTCVDGLTVGTDDGCEPDD
jgi:poly(A) polymerase